MSTSSPATTQVLWIRRLILRYLAKRLFLEFLAVTILLWILLSGIGWTQASIAPFALVVAEFFVITRVVVGLATNPLSQQVVDAHIENPTRLARGPLEVDGLGKIAVELGLQGFHPLFTAIEKPGSRSSHSTDETEGRPESLFDILQSRDGQTTAALGRTGETITLISQVTDGRLVVTTDLLIPPDDRLIVNVLPNEGPQVLAESHRRLVSGLQRTGLHSRPTSPSVIIDLLAIEHQTYQSLGPFLTPFLALDLGRRSTKLGFRLAPTTVLGRSSLNNSEKTLRISQVSPETTDTYINAMNSPAAAG